MVATDDERIARAVESFGGAAIMTRADHVSGTDRIAEVVAQLPCRLVVNVQGDEPLIEPETIDAAIAPMLADPALEMSTLCRPLAGDHELRDQERREGRDRPARPGALLLRERRCPVAPLILVFMFIGATSC